MVLVLRIYSIMASTKTKQIYLCKWPDVRLPHNNNIFDKLFWNLYKLYNIIDNLWITITERFTWHSYIQRNTSNFYILSILFCWKLQSFVGYFCPWQLQQQDYNHKYICSTTCYTIHATHRKRNAQASEMVWKLHELYISS